MIRILFLILLIGAIFRPVQTKSFLDSCIDSVHGFAGSLFREAERSAYKH